MHGRPCRSSLPLPLTVPLVVGARRHVDRCGPSRDTVGVFAPSRESIRSVTNLCDRNSGCVKPSGLRRLISLNPTRREPTCPRLPRRSLFRGFLKSPSAPPLYAPGRRTFVPLPRPAVVFAGGKVQSASPGKQSVVPCAGRNRLDTGGGFLAGLFPPAPVAVH